MKTKTKTNVVHHSTPKKSWSPNNIKSKALFSLQFPIPNFSSLKLGFLALFPNRSELGPMSLNSPFKHRLLSILLCVLGLGFGFGSDALKLPFRVNDVLPVLPHQISWPVLNNFHSAVDLLPAFVGSVSPNNGTLEWKGACFYGNEARLEFTESDRDEPTLGGGVLYLKVTLVVPPFFCLYLSFC